jgi:hypothetical protein
MARCALLVLGCITHTKCAMQAENTLWGPQQDVKSTVVMNNVLEAEKPDFVYVRAWACRDEHG